jgi:hypothetical protein
MGKTNHETLAEVGASLGEMSPQKAAELGGQMRSLREAATKDGTLHAPADSKVGRLSLNARLAKGRNS